jgi:tyrosine-protein kinase Etk/Wzc
MSTVISKTEEHEKSLVSSLMFRFAPYWPLFILLSIIGGAGAWMYLQFATPMYNAYANIMLKDEKKGVDDAKVLDLLNVYTSKKIVENEIEVIRSRTLMNDVVNKLHLYAPVYEDGRFKDLIAYTSSPIRIEAQNPDTITATGAIYFTYNQKKSSVTIEKKAYPINEWVTTPYGVLKFSENGNKRTTAIHPLYFVIRSPQNIAGGMVNRLGVSPISKAATVLDLTYSDESPKRAQDVLNALIDSYIKNTITEKNALASNTLSFIEERLHLVEKDLEAIERTIQQYKSQKGIVDLSEQGKQFLANVSNTDREVSNINMQLAVLDKVDQYVRSKKNEAGIVPATLGLTDEVLARSLQRLYDKELEYNRLKETVAENSPSLTAITSEIESIRPTILESVENQRESLMASRNNLSVTSNVYSSMLRTIPQKERELLEISRQQTIKNNVYSFLLQKREETALSASSTVADSRLIDAAQASFSPVSPKRSMIYFGALAIAFLISVALVIAKEMMSSKILFRSDIEGFTRVPIAAEIISVKHKGELVVSSPDKVYIAEQFRQLRASIGLYGRTTSKSKILVTSSIAGEGKSFVASNLALSLALSGKKVVLLDADLRSPKTSAIFDLEQEQGLAEYLEGRQNTKEIIKQSSVNNLAVIPAGGACVNPTELLLNGKLNELFSHLETAFDYVLVDTSPIDPVTDAYVLSEYCDRTLFVIRHAYTPKTMVQLLDDNNKIKALNNPAIVFNGVKKRGFLKGGYGFGYGFGYEYVYKERGDLRTKKSKPTLRQKLFGHI